jgi:hypothetical protein
VRRTLVLALALAAGTLVPAAAAAAAGEPQAGSDPGSIGIRLLDVPVTAAEDPRARNYIVDHLTPGATIKRRVEIDNTTQVTQSIALYPGAASIHGGSFHATEGRTPSELTQWTTLDRASVPLQSRQRSTVEVTIKVPPDASPGERYGAVWAEIAGPTPTGGGVSLVNRAGVRMYLDIGPGGAPASKFTVDGLTATRAADGSPSVVAQVRNTGGRALDIRGDLKLSDGPGGLSAGPFPATLGVTLAPGDSAPVIILLDRQIPDGPWQADLKLSSGLLTRTTNATLRFPTTAGSLNATAAHTGLPWSLLAIGTGTGLPLVLALGLLRHRRARRPDPATPPAPSPV